MFFLLANRLIFCSCCLPAVVFFSFSPIFFSLANNVNKDVFEAFYLKRTSKSSHSSSKSSNDSFRGTDDTTPTHTNQQTYFGNDGKSSVGNKVAKFGQNDKFGSVRSEKSRPNQQYLFGGTVDRQSPRDEQEKENIFYKNSNQKPNDRFKTITINSLRRSFRDTFLDSSKPAKGREHQQLWFIDVNDSNNKKSEPLDRQSNGSAWRSNQSDDRNNAVSHERTRSPVKRNETFRIDDNNRKSHSVSRKETFRVQDRIVEPRMRQRSPSIESNNSPTLRSESKNSLNERNGKMVPIAVTAPYSALNDSNSCPNIRPYKSINQSNDFDRHSIGNENCSPIESRKFNDNSMSNYDNHNNQHEPFRRDQSPINRSNNYSPFKSSTSKTLIEIKLPDTQRHSHNSNNNANENDDEPFENRALTERQSFRELNDGIIRPRTHRSYTSLRMKLEQTALNQNRYRPQSSLNSYNGSYNYDNNGNDDDAVDGKMEKPLPQQNYQREAWRSISSRRFSKDSSEDTENRSFVPYHSNKNSYPYTTNNKPKYNDTTNENETKPKHYNRTTININYNYNLNPNKNNHIDASLMPSSASSSLPPTPLSTPSNQHYPTDTNTFTRPSTVNKSASAIKSNQIGKEKTNKNRSVNFPSVECEVRLISPNYETKPRRKETWKSKPAPKQDWTFNKVHF